MNFKKLRKDPKNPRHFISLMFKLLRDNPSACETEGYLIVEKEFMDKALVRCAYGYFYISKNRMVLSKHFF